MIKKPFIYNVFVNLQNQQDARQTKQIKLEQLKSGLLSQKYLSEVLLQQKGNGKWKFDS